jgi:hypothetical protein
MRQGVIRGLGFFFVSAIAASASASVAWSSPSGTTPTYNYSNGESVLGLFGDPLVLANSFVFFPSDFKATASNGSSQTTTDSLSFDITCKPNQKVTAVTVNELGDYSILGSGSVKAEGTLIITDLITSANTLSPLISTPASPITTTTSAAGSWTATATAVNLPNGWTTFHVILTNILQASADAESSSVIQKKFTQAGLEVSIIVPEPASIGVLLTAGSGLLLRRRR